jgi:hypothetical protein
MTDRTVGTCFDTRDSDYSLCVDGREEQQQAAKEMENE